MSKNMPFAMFAPVAGLLLMGAASPGLDGVWSGDRHVLRFSARDVTLETDCANASFAPALVDKEGRFRVEGRYIAQAPGPQSAMDEGPAAGQPATLVGWLRGSTLELQLSVMGLAPQQLRLEQGNKVKLMRCY